MKEWWTTKAWPWVKDHWQWILFPVGLLLLVLRFIPRGVVTVDPTAKADERATAEKARRDAEAAEEKARRDAALQEERAALQARLETVRAEHRSKLGTLTSDQQQAAAALEEDPEALNEFLRGL